MKKTLTAAIIFALLLSALCLSASASEALKPTQYEKYGQITLKAADGGTSSNVDGVIEENEYTNAFRFTSETDGVALQSLFFPAYPEYVELYITNDTDYIFIGIVIKENYCKFRNTTTNTAGSWIALSFGFNMGPYFYQSMDRETLTLNLTSETELFKANTILKYNEDGTYASSYNSNVYEAAAGKRNEDKKETVYECQIKKAELAANLGLEKIENEYYIHFVHNSFADSSTNSEFRYRAVLDDEAKDEIRAADGWVATFAPHVLSFDKANEPAVITIPEETTAVETTEEITEEITTAEITTAAATVPETPAETTAAATPAETTAAKAPEGDVTTEASVPKDGKSGCGSFAAAGAAIIALLGCAVIFKKH